jgi:hypothetical protein
MSIVGGDGITLPKITKCADIKHKKTRHMAYRHRGVFYVVIAGIKNGEGQCRPETG